MSRTLSRKLLDALSRVQSSMELKAAEELFLFTLLIGLDKEVYKENYQLVMTRTFHSQHSRRYASSIVL
jgi:hypothetical protein